MNFKNLWVSCCCFLLASCSLQPDWHIKPNQSDLHFPSLAKSWDEGIPLGNATIGALVWQKGDQLRFSLDRVDLWDLRPVDSLSGENYRFSWVVDQVNKGDYAPVQKKFDHPYDRMPAPSKIPGAALEIPIAQIGEPESVSLFLENALCKIMFRNGVEAYSFVDANNPVGWIEFRNLPDSLSIRLVPPAYECQLSGGAAASYDGLDLARLGYKQGDVVSKGNFITYRQQGWGEFYYDVAVKWQRNGKRLRIGWSVTSSHGKETAMEEIDKGFERGFHRNYLEHLKFWDEYWAASEVEIPEPKLQKQYMNDMYKFGSAAREHSYPISLQAVWTADNGKLPPWKGDYHHDLNTQLSYWPCYTGNHLKEGLGYLNTLWKQQGVNKEFTKKFYGLDGLNVPGVCTLEGEPMGGWIQYSMGPTVSAWLAQHFYLHYVYSADHKFLQERAYPYIKEVATFLEQLTYVNDEGVRTLPLSSSPEIFDNSIKAWFKTITNHDLAMVYSTFDYAHQLAKELNLKEEAKRWNKLRKELPNFDLDSLGALTFAKDFPYNVSHRHLGHLAAIHPMGIYDWANGERDQKVISESLKRIEEVGPSLWCGYSYSWLGNIKARAYDGDGAAEALRTFADCFCLQNTFHVNGDQSKSGKSNFTYRPFTLEGNFAFASGIQEMLLQSHRGYIEVFPAIPSNWNNVIFKNLRAQGAYLVSAIKTGNEVELTIVAERGGVMLAKVPQDADVQSKEIPTFQNGNLRLEMKAGNSVIIKYQIVH